MLSISPIKSSYKATLPLINPQGCSTVPVKLDTFEHATKNISFGSGVNLRFPVKETEELFTKALEEIKRSETIDQKTVAAKNCIEKFKKDILYRGRENSVSNDEKMFRLDRVS